MWVVPNIETDIPFDGQVCDCGDKLYQSEISKLRTENDRLQEALIECQGLLVDMVNQYCRNNSDEPTTYSHDFMSTGEAVFEYLVNHGLAEWAGGEDIRLIWN